MHLLHIARRMLSGHLSEIFAGGTAASNKTYMASDFTRQLRTDMPMEDALSSWATLRFIINGGVSLNGGLEGF